MARVNMARVIWLGIKQFELGTSVVSLDCPCHYSITLTLLDCSTALSLV